MKDIGSMSTSGNTGKNSTLNLRKRRKILCFNIGD